MVIKKITKLLGCTAICSSLLAFSAGAKEIDMNTAKLQAMDKITGKVSVVEAPVNAEAFFGTFSIVARSCKTRTPEETPENFAFVDIVDNYKTENPVNVFRGWMMSSTPALNSVAHPIYDVWLLGCINTDVSKTKKLSSADLKTRSEIQKKAETEEDNKPIIDIKKIDHFENAEEEKQIQEIDNRDLGGKNAIENPAIAVEAKDATEDGKTVSLQEAKKQVNEVANADEVVAKMEMAHEEVQDVDAPKSLLNIGDVDTQAEPVAQPIAKPLANDEVSSEFIVIKQGNENVSSVVQSSAVDAVNDTPVEQQNMAEGIPADNAKMPELLNQAEPMSQEELHNGTDEENGMAADIPLVTGDEIEENGMVEEQLINLDEVPSDMTLQTDSLAN